MDVSQRLDVEAGPAGFVLAEFLEQSAVLLEPRHDVQRETVLARCEGHQGPVPLLPAFVLVVIAAESDHAGAHIAGFSPVTSSMIADTARASCRRRSSGTLARNCLTLPALR